MVTSTPVLPRGRLGMESAFALASWACVSSPEPRLTAVAVASAPAWRNERRSVLFEGSVDMATGSPLGNRPGNMVVTRYLLTMILPTSTRVSKAVSCQSPGIGLVRHLVAGVLDDDREQVERGAADVGIAVVELADQARSGLSSCFVNLEADRERPSGGNSPWRVDREEVL